MSTAANKGYRAQMILKIAITLIFLGLPCIIFGFAFGSPFLRIMNGADHVRGIGVLMLVIGLLLLIVGGAVGKMRGII